MVVDARGELLCDQERYYVFCILNAASCLQAGSRPERETAGALQAHMSVEECGNNAVAGILAERSLCTALTAAYCQQEGLDWQLPAPPPEPTCRSPRIARRCHC